MAKLKEYLESKKKGAQIIESPLSLYLKKKGLKTSEPKKIENPEPKNPEPKNPEPKNPEPNFEERFKELFEQFNTKFSAMVQKMEQKINPSGQKSEEIVEEIEDFDATDAHNTAQVQKKSDGIPLDFDGIFKELRVPSSNQEPLVNMIRGQGVDVDAIDNQQELLGIFQETLKKYPIFTRSTQYKSVQNPEPNKRATKQDVTNLTMTERSKLFADKLEKLS